MNYPSKRAYYENENDNNAKEPCYAIGHKDAVYTKDDESETLGTKLTEIETDITTNFNKIGDLSGSGLTETDLATAIKNDRSSLSDITNQIVTTPSANKLLKLDSNSKLPTSITGDADSIDGIQGNQIPLMTTSNITYYVNTSTGNDTNNGLTSGTAFKTITKAINMLPQVVNHIATINVASGTSSENVSVNGFIGRGSININGGSSSSDSANYVAGQFLAQNCFVPVNINGFQATLSTQYASGFSSINSQYLKVNNCSCTANGTSTNARGASGLLGGYIYVTNSQFSNRAYALYTENAGRVESYNNTGSGNTIALGAYSGGEIYQGGSTQPSGTTAQATGDGGAIR